MSVTLSSQRFPLAKELKNILIGPFEFVYYLLTLHSVKLTKTVRHYNITSYKRLKLIVIINNCESHKMGATQIPCECLWHEGWPVWGFVGVELVQSSYSPLRTKIASYAPVKNDNFLSDVVIGS